MLAALVNREKQSKGMEEERRPLPTITIVQFTRLVQYSRRCHFGKIWFSVDLKLQVKTYNSRFSLSLKSKNFFFFNERNKTLKTIENKRC